MPDDQPDIPDAYAALRSALELAYAALCSGKHRHSRREKVARNVIRQAIGGPAAATIAKAERAAAATRHRDPARGMGEGSGG